MTNPVRPCYGCLVFDDHPRHEIVGAQGQALPGDEVNGPMHMDCCADKRGCVICGRAREGLAPSIVGEAFRTHVLSLPPLAVEHVENDDPADPHNLTTARLVELEG